MSKQWIPLGSKPRPGSALTAFGALVVGLTVFTPLFGTTAMLSRGKLQSTNYSLWELRSAAPGVGWLVAGAVLLLVLAMLPGRYRSRIVTGGILGVAVAEAFGLLLAVAIGFAQLADKLDKVIEFRWGIPFLISGVAVLICGGVGGWQQGTSTYEK